MGKDSSQDSYNIFKEDGDEFYEHLLEKDDTDSEEFFEIPKRAESLKQESSLKEQKQETIEQQEAEVETKPQSIDLEKEPIQEELTTEPVVAQEQDQGKVEESTEDMDSQNEDKKTFSIDNEMTDDDIQSLLGEVFSEGVQEKQNESSTEDILSEDEVLSGDEAEKQEPELTILEEEKVEEEPEEKKKKPNLFARIFGNIREERTEEEVQKLKDKVYADAETKEAIEKAKKEREAAMKAAKQEKKKKQAEEKKAKAAEAKKVKAEKAKAKKEEKAAKKDAKAKKKQEIQKLLDEIDENEGKINKVGAGIIFAFFAIIAVVLVVGTKSYSYQISIKNAKDHFEYNHYNEAYEEVTGLKIQEQDQELYDKIMTVMYVNKELNSYYNYYNLEMYPEALDSLIKGLKRYELYLSIGRSYGIEEDLDFVKAEILTELKDVFHVSEAEAYKIVGDQERVNYSSQIYSYVQERFVPPVKEPPQQEEQEE